MTTERENFCEVCTLYKRFISTGTQCRYLYMLKSGEICPCIECLIKPICVKACYEFDMYTIKSDHEKLLDSEHNKEYKNSGI